MTGNPQEHVRKNPCVIFRAEETWKVVVPAKRNVLIQRESLRVSAVPKPTYHISTRELGLCGGRGEEEEDVGQ